MHIKGRRIGKGFSGAALALAGAAFFIKEQALVLVGLVGLYECIFRRESLKAKVAALAPWIGITFLFLAWRIFLFPGFGANVLVAGYETTQRLLSIPGIIVTDLGLVFWPAGLHYYRSIDILAPHLWAWGVLAGSMAVFCWAFSRANFIGRRRILFGTGFAFLTFLPGMNVFPLINEYSQVMVAEHFFYLPLAGILLMAAGLLTGIFQRIRCAWLAIVIVVLVAVLSILTVRQTGFWRNETVLFERVLTFEPQLGRVHLLLARAYVREGRFTDAIKEYATALRILENYVKRTPAGSAPHRFYQIFVNEARSERAFCYMTSGDMAVKRVLKELAAGVAGGK
jgi:hypothetical protein